MSLASFALSLNIDPPSLKVILKAGGTKSGEISIQNTGSSPIQIKAYAEDWIYAADGSKTFMKAGSSVYSCSGWIKLDPATFELSPKEEKKVSYTITAPYNSSGGHVSVIFFEGLIGQTNEIAVSGRIGAIVYQDTEGDIKRIGETGNITVAGSREGEPLTIRVPLTNKGNTYISAKTKITILRDNKTVLESQKLINTLPGETAACQLNAGKSLKEGKYKAVAETSFDDKTLKSQAEFTIKK